MLIQLNHKVIPATIDVLSECATFTKNHLVPPLTTAINSLIAGNFTYEHSIVTAAGFIISIFTCLKPHITDRLNLKEKIVIKILDTLCKRYQPAAVNEMLTKLLSDDVLLSKNRIKLTETLEKYFAL